ncbi:aquaporin [Pseudofrankia asymbiotica]|uniref:aquaporin n=1 Tax=Pseudofrankia asymbiotica TaxID=1834516 RepID=UPI0030827E78
MGSVPGGQPALWRRLTAELVGAVLLAALVVGSGIAARQLSPTDLGLQLAENAAATAAGLFAIILMIGPVSGAHLNPAVTILRTITHDIGRRGAAGYIAA